MFQDYDNEILCSVLFEQCGGDLDKSIETILKMQKVQTGTQASSLADSANPDGDGTQPVGTSLGGDEDEGATPKVPNAATSVDVDKAT